MIKSEPIGFMPALWLLLRLQVLRSARQLTGGLRLFQKKMSNAKRAATPGKTKNSWLIGGFVALSMTIAFSNIARQAVLNIEETAGTIFVPNTAKAKPAPAAKTPVANPQSPNAGVRVRLAPAPGFTLAPNVLKGLALEALFLLIAITLLAIGNGELTRPDWDLEWLTTLPVPLSTLLSARILARSIVNPLGLVALLPFVAIVAWETGFRGESLLIALAVAAPLFLIAGTVQTLCDTGLRLNLGPSQLRNFQAVISIISVIALFFAMSPGMPAKASYVLDWASGMPAWTFWLPPALAIQTIVSTSPLFAAQSFGLLALEAVLFAVVGVALLKRQLRSGIVAAGARESGRRERVRRAAGGSADRPARRYLLTPIQARELRLLARDRTFFVQTLIMPIILVGSQIFFQANGSALLSSVVAHPQYLASIAFGISAYALMFSAFQTLNAEGQALWILYCVPQSLESILRQKAALWGVACLLYPVAIFGFVVASRGVPSTVLLELAVIVLLGIPIFAIIATSLGVFACDPLAQVVQRRVKISYTYLYMLLSSIYIYSVFANSFWQRLSLLILTALLAVALWQKARDHLPYLLDPAASPPARVSISDGLIAALLFFVLQGLVLIISVGSGGKLTGYNVLVAFSIAGAATFGMMRLAFWRLHSQGVPRTFGWGASKALAMGALGGVAAAIAAFIYLRLAVHTALFEQAHQTILFSGDERILIAILAIGAAPVFEEFIFRGLIYGGLRRSMGVAGAVLASAAIFAIVHPPASVIPVFGLGMVTALIYERTRLLIGPMAAHATYNALVVGAQFLL
jgi:ABC-2 type transport system permease protein